MIEHHTLPKSLDLFCLPKSTPFYYLPKVEIKDYNVMIDGKNFFDQPINSMTKTYENIRKIATGQGDDYTTGCLLDYSYFIIE